MKNMKLIALFICLSVIVCSLAGCSKTAPLEFKLNGGTLADEKPVEFTNNADLALPVPTQKYYKFMGWSLTSDLANILDGNKLPKDMELTDEQVKNGLVLYAAWERLTGKITYDLDGGAWDGNKGIDTYKYGEVLELPGNVVRDHFEFDGWTLDGEDYDEVPLDQERDINLVANWTQLDTKINFVLLNDEATPLDVSEYFDTATGLVIDSAEYQPTAPGAFFLGWYLSEADATDPDTEAERVIEIDAGTTEEVTLYAKWLKGPTIDEDTWLDPNN